MKPQRTPFRHPLNLYLMMWTVFTLPTIAPQALLAETPPAITCESNCICISGFEIGDCEASPSNVTLLSESDLGNILNNTLINACVNVYGKLVIDENFTFSHCTIIMDPASSIEVNPNVKLTIKSQSVLHGCEYMWRGINLPGQARLEIDSSTVRDAHYAIRALHFSRIKLTASTFDANYIGVYIPPPTPPNVQNIVFRLNGSPNDIKDNYFGFLSAYLSPYSGQSPHPGSSPYAGFFLNNANAFYVGHPSNGSVENVFEDLKYGIIDIAGFGNIYSGCQMANLDAAWPEGIGVRIIDNVGKITVRDCDMEEVRCGVLGNNHRALDLLNNEIEGLYYGINLYDGKRNVRIEDNTIAADDCIFISGSNNGNFPIDIKSNFLTPRSHGIYTGNVNGKLHIVENNEIYMDYEPGSAHGIFGLLNSGPAVIKNSSLTFTDPDAVSNTGIAIVDCKNGQVVENTISGSSSNPYNLGLGIVGFNSPNYLYCCNELDDTQIGESFILMCNDNKLANTVFDDHYTALYLSNAVISPQINNGNNWAGATTTEDARFDGIGFDISLSSIVTNSGLVPNGYSKVFVSSGWDPTDWFTFDGTDPICEDWTDEDEYCGKDPYFLVEDPNEFTSLTSTDLVAIDPPQGNDTTAVLNWEWQRYLFEKLVNNPGLVVEDTAVDTFYTEAQSGLIGELHAVESGIRSLFFPQDTLSAGYFDILSDLEDLEADLWNIGEQLWTAGEVERDSLMTEIDTLTTEQIAPLLEELAVMETEIAAWRGDRVAELQIGNAAITPDSAYQEYEQVAYAIFLSTIAQGEAALSIGQQDTLENIAVLCPLIAGSGVFWARYILQYYIPGLAWEVDECEGLEERSGGAVKKEAETTTTARVFPNPTRGSLTVQLSSPLSQEGTLSIYNVDGKTLFSEKLETGTLERQFDIKDLPTGIFVCEVKESTKLVYSSRVIVVK